MSSQKKEPPSNKKIVQSIDTTDFDGRLALAGKFIFVAPWNSTSTAIQMDRYTKEEQASTVKRCIVHINCDKLKHNSPPPHYVAIGTASSIMSPLTSSSQSLTKQSWLSVAPSTKTTTTATTTVEDAKQKPERVIKRRHSMVNAQHSTADKTRKRKIEDQAFL